MVSDTTALCAMDACLPRIVLPVVQLRRLAVPQLLVPPVSLVDARREHRHQHHDGDGERDEARK